ncbi:amino acid ABC transporter permease [Acidimangrovimonas sediminis]|uniref:amino acid ABC transporter permease n=1 Tax=Acidimangrovimonas sediminis TaxID=2056283 RepID=UPI000C80FAD5|nr:amino acid ABC transporter permease [Acidimangrovimonas sediminis]
MNFSHDLMTYAVPVLTKGALSTLKLGLLISVASLVFGVILSFGLAAPNRVLRRLSRGLIAAMRGIPPLILILIAFYVLPDLGVMLSPIAAGCGALIVYFSAYVAVAVRGALDAVPAGQIEAALSIGMTSRARMLRVIVPLAWPILLPALCGLLIGLFKETALLSIISVPELTFETKQAVARTYAPFEIYAMAALLYWAWSALLETLSRKLEAIANRHKNPGTRRRQGASS